MGLIAWIVVGLIAGWLADMVLGGGSRLSISDLILGVIGALVGGFLASNLFGVPDPLSGINITTLIVAFIGAVIVVAIVRALSGRRRVV